MRVGAGHNMHLKYVHYFGNESTESILEAYGLTSKSEQIDKLRPKSCPNCSEPNKVDSKFCAKCRMVLSYDAYAETIEQKQDELGKLKNDMNALLQALVSKGVLEPTPKPGLSIQPKTEESI